MILDVLTPASVHFLWSSPKCLIRLCLTLFSSLRSSLLLVHISLPNFFLPVNFAFNMLWYITTWTASPFSNDPLWLTLFVEGVNDHLLDHCQVSSVPRYCGFKEQDIPTSYTVWMVIYRNSNVNILILLETDFWLSLAISSNHQNKNKKTFEVFYFTCNESKIYESFTFWNKFQEKMKNMKKTFSTILYCDGESPVGIISNYVIVKKTWGKFFLILGFQKSTHPLDSWLLMKISLQHL